MQKQKTQREAVFWLIPFLLGLLIFLFPVVQEQISYRTDADEYAAMAQQLRPPVPYDRRSLHNFHPFLPYLS